jgi:hypothetical protein
MSAHGQGLQRFRDRTRTADFDDTIDARSLVNLRDFTSGSDSATQRQRLIEGSSTTARMGTGAPAIGHAARPKAPIFRDA